MTTFLFDTNPKGYLRYCVTLVFYCPKVENYCFIFHNSLVSAPLGIRIKKRHYFLSKIFNSRIDFADAKIEIANDTRMTFSWSKGTKCEFFSNRILPVRLQLKSSIEQQERVARKIRSKAFSASMIPMSTEKFTSSKQVEYVRYSAEIEAHGEVFF